MTPLNRDDGFTLIELMVVVVIVGILAAIAYPSYTRYVVEARRADGQAGALQLAAQLEKYFTQCGQYTSAINSGSISACTGLGLPNANSPDGNYAMQVALANANATYTITAQPQGAQAATDTDCANLTLTSAGVKSQSGPNTRGRCWRR